MGLCEVMSKLEGRGVYIGEWKIRYAMKTGKITTHPIDMSHRYDFSKKNLNEIANYFGSKTAVKA